MGHRATLSACRQQRGGSAVTTATLTYQTLVGSLFLVHIVYSTMQYTTLAMEAQDFDGIVDDEVLIPWKKARPRGPPRFGKRSLPPAVPPYTSDEASEMRQVLIRSTPLHSNVNKNVYFMLKRGAADARHEDGNAEMAPSMLFFRRWLQDASAAGDTLPPPMPLAFVERHLRSVSGALEDAPADSAASFAPAPRAQRAIHYPRPSTSRLLMLPKSF